MKLILNDHIENLGERGDSVVVKAGYANNFLLPKGLAYHDTPGNRKRVAQEQTGWGKRWISSVSVRPKSWRRISKAPCSRSSGGPVRKTCSSVR